jgi:hypothetical protein
MQNRLIYNPFSKVAGFYAFTLGIVVLGLTSYLAYFTGTHYYGLFRIDFAKDSPYWFYLLNIASHWIVLSLLVYVSGLVFSKSAIRAIDVFGTILLAKAPLILTPAIRVFPCFDSFLFMSSEMYALILIYILTLLYTSVLLFNAIRVSCNLKGERLIILFIVCLIVSEISILILNNFIL